jgi:hypothetical protein
MAQVPPTVSGGVHNLAVGGAGESPNLAPGGPRGNSNSAPSRSVVAVDLLAVILCRRELLPPVESGARRPGDSGTDPRVLASGPVHPQLGQGRLSNARPGHRSVSPRAIGAGSGSVNTTVGRARSHRPRVRAARRRVRHPQKTAVAPARPTAAGLHGFTHSTGAIGAQASKVALSLAPVLAAGLVALLALVLAWRAAQRATWRKRASAVKRSVING